jgi:Domain of Unknown Function (DUF349)
MSLISRLFGKSPPATAAPPPTQPAVAAASPPRPDPAERRSEEDARLSEAIAAGDRAAVGKWVLEGSSTQVRQRAAQAVNDPDQLRELVRATRHGNDKNVHRILVAKRDALLAEERRLEQQQVEVEASAAAIAQHTERPVDATYAGTLAVLEARWQSAAAHATPDLQRTVTEQLARARDALERHRLAAETDAAQQRAAALAAALAAEEARQQRERDAQVAAEAAAEQARSLEAERRAAQEKREAEDAEVRRVLGLLRQTQAALDHGGTARATRLRASIEEALAQTPALPPWFAVRLQQVDARLAELRDWKTFTVVPKRGELLARIQALVGAEMSPEELAKHIRRLRDEWRTLHRGAGEDPSPEWQQFEEAAERAYEPCREHFAKQAAHRKANQSRRETLIERLAAFAAEQDGEQPDWRAIQQVLVEARREWREYAPVDQGIVKELQARFHAVLEPLQARLDAEHAGNVQAKRELIARAAALAGVPDTRAAIEQAKELQREWKTLGPVPRQHDHALWEEFRRHSDAVFQRSAQESAAYGAALAAGESRAGAICEELEHIAALEGEPLLAAGPALDALHAEFEALELPRTSARALRQRISQAGERCEEAVRRGRAAAARRGWMDVLAAAAAVRVYALAIAQGQPADECGTRRAAAESAVAGLAHAPKTARAALEDQLTKVAEGRVDTVLAANEAALRLLCVRAELIAGLPTPPEDHELRGEYQMQRLVAAMGQGERTGPGELSELVLEWLSVGPVEAAVEAALRGRIERCWEAGGR